MNEQEIEQEIRRKGLTARRLSPDGIDALIVGETYAQMGDGTVTVCCLTLRNGFTVVGHSAPISPENFDLEVGRKVAKRKARDGIWALEGYRLKQELFEAEQSGDSGD